MPWYQGQFGQTRVDWQAQPPAMWAGNIITGVTAQPVPSSLPLGGSAIPGIQMFHVTVTLATGPATIQFPHGLLYKPLAVWVIAEGAEGVTPVIFTAWCPNDTNANNVAIIVSAAGTYDVYYG